MTGCVQNRKTKKGFDNKEDYTTQISNFHFHKIIARQIKRKNVRKFHKRKEKSVAAKSQQSPLKINPIEETPKGFSQNFVKTKEIKTEAERSSTGPPGALETITRNTQSRDKIFTRLYP